MKNAIIGLISLLVSGLALGSVDPEDSGVWESPGDYQGFVFQYAPVIPPALVAYWFTYDEDGNQAWFISDNIPVGASSTEITVSLYKPYGFFLDEAALGEPVGVLAVSKQGDRLVARFGLAEGYSDECSIQVPQAPIVSPPPPPIDSEAYPCQSRLVLIRITPVVQELVE